MDHIQTLPQISFIAKEGEFFGPRSNLRSHIAFNCPVPLVSFKLKWFLQSFIFHDLVIFEVSYFVECPSPGVCPVFPRG